MLFASNMAVRDGEGGSAVTALAEDSQQKAHPLTVEYAGGVSGFDWLTQIIVKLPDDLAGAGDVWVSINLRGAASNKALIKIE
jgi:uncharacterized protein (TIGR03437 family)